MTGREIRERALREINDELFKEKVEAEKARRVHAQIVSLAA